MRLFAGSRSLKQYQEADAIVVKALGDSDSAPRISTLLDRVELNLREIDKALQQAVEANNNEKKLQPIYFT